MPVYMDSNQHPYTIGFGNYSELPHPLVGGTLEVTNGLVASYPFYTAKDAIITDIGVSMMVVENVDLGAAAADMYMQLFYKIDTTYFIAIPETKIVLSPTLTGNVAAGTLFEMIVNNLNIPVAAATRLMLVIHKDIIQEDQNASLVVMMSGSIYLKNT